MSTCTSNGERRLEGRCNSAARETSSCCDPWSADKVRTSLFQHGETLTNVIRSAFRVSVHACNDVAPRCTDCCIQPGRNDALRVIDDSQARIFCRQSIEDLASAVIRHAVCDDDLKAFG